MIKNDQTKVTSKDKEISMPEDNNVEFPKDFLWGASVASHQVEGGNHNQWTEWEKANADRLAQKSFKEFGHQKNWADIKSQAQDPLNYISGDGVKHYEMYEQDFAILKDLNLNAFRFGIEWSRLEPEEGQWDEVAVEHYREYIAELKKQNITPILNLWHWTQPVWFEAKGGFSKKRNLKYWQRFVQKVADEYCRELEIILTINEFNVYSGASFIAGIWPPQKKNLVVGVIVAKNLVRAHKVAYKIIKTSNPHIRIGAATSFIAAKPKYRFDILARITARFLQYVWDWWFVNRTKKYIDFVGFNFYTTLYVKGIMFSHPTRGLKTQESANDLGWYMEPASVKDLILQAAKRYKLPIMITENGVADSKDQYRQWWIEETIKAISSSINSGANVIGYLHWSLLDNFEWDKGWWPKFGLVAVDREHGMKRTIRPSARWYAEKIAKLSK